MTALAAKAKSADGAPPFSDQALVDFRLGSRELVAIDQDAAALVAGAEAEFVVAPDARGRGLGTRMLEQLLASGTTLLWAHGDHPAARALAASQGLKAIRELLHLVGPVSDRATGLGQLSGRLAADEGAGVIETFVPKKDEEEWVTLNAHIFAQHAEQGSVSRADLDELEGEPWFSADNFLVMRRDNRMIGYCWLKVEGESGEFYVVGVSADHQGEHLGSILFDAGLARLAALGIRHAHLYVEGDNEPALRLYTSRGFERDSIDIQYSA